MRSNVAKKIANPNPLGISMLGASVLGIITLAGGCQQQQNTPLRLSVIADEAAPDHAAPIARDGPYMNPDWHDTDDAAGGIFYTVLSQTGSAISTVFSPVVEIGSRSIRFLSDDKPSHAYQLMEDKNSADNRREGINKMADFGFLTSANFRKRCRQIAQDDTDFTVRATAIRTANRARDNQATPLFITGLTDHNESIRLESAKALANVPDVKASEPLVALLNNREEDRDIRIAAADALKHYRTLTAVRALTLALDDKAFAISWQARRSLRYLTDKDFGYSSSAWLAYFTGPDNPLR